MNKQEELKSNIIRSCVEGIMTVKSAALKLNISERHVKNLKKKYREEGSSSILHGNYGRQPARTISIQTKQRIVEIKNLEQFNTVNITHFMEILEQEYQNFFSDTINIVFRYSVFCVGYFRKKTSSIF